MNAPDAQRGDSREGHVEIRVPAEAGYVSTLRLCAASLAARCDLTVDDIEDLRLAVDEACALLLPHAQPGGVLLAGFDVVARQLGVTVSIETDDRAEVDRAGFAWTVLGALADSVDVTSGSGRLGIALTKRREAALQ